MLRFLSALVISLIPSTALLAADVQPVPGSAAAYLYFPAEGAGRVKLKIVKEFANVVQDRYEVYFQLRNRRQELICGFDEDNCEKTVPAGQGRLTIKGFYDTAKKLPISMATFTGACSTTGTRCDLNLKDGNTETVRIVTGCNATEYSVILLDDKNRPNDKNAVLCVGPVPDGSGYLLAAYKSIRSNFRAKTSTDAIGAKDSRNGKENTAIMLSKWSASIFPVRESAAHYCNNLSIGSGNNRYNDWYVPAEQELNLVLAGWDAAKQSFIIPKDATGYWASNEVAGGRGGTNMRVYRWSGNSKNTTDRGINDPASVICVYRVPM